MKEFRIRESIPQYMSELKEWLDSTRGAVPEEMDAFFTARIDGYEEHMKEWERAYQKMGEMIPKSCESLLDLGCGTGLELDEIFKHVPNVKVTGIDLSEAMLQKLKAKHPQVNVICADYFAVPFGEECYDVVVSVESLHHFDGPEKQNLFEKIQRALRKGGQYFECDYIACCDEEEGLLRREYDARCKNIGTDSNTYFHFDIPLTLEHEMQLMRNAAFSSVCAVDCINGATFIVCTK